MLEQKCYSPDQPDRGNMYEQDSDDQRLEQLSEQAASEKDAKKFIELIGELNILLKEKRSSASDKKAD
jgi:hypothetical protein